MIIQSAPTLRDAYAANNDRGPGFDTLRLVAASAVVLHHAGSISHDIVHDDVIFRFSGGYTHIGLLAVSVFFALSGFLVAPGLLKSGDVIEYLSRRFMRIMPLLTAVVMLTIVLVGPILTNHQVGEYFEDPETWNYLRNVSTLLSPSLPGVSTYDGGSSVNSPLWSLHFEWLCYIILALATLLGAIQHRWFFLALYILAAFVLVVGFGPVAADTDAGRGFRLLYLFGYFGAGVAICLLRDVLRWSKTLMAIALLALTLSLWLGLGYIFAPILVSYIVVGFGLLKFPWRRVLERSDLSYGVYLTHSLMLSLLAKFFEFSSWLFFFAVGLACSLAIAWISWNLIERPALNRKSLPADLLRRFVSGVISSIERRAPH